MQLDKAEVDAKIKALNAQAYAHARRVQTTWINMYVGEHGYTYDEGEKFIRDPLKYEESRTVFDI